MNSHYYRRVYFERVGLMVVTMGLQFFVLYHLVQVQALDLKVFYGAALVVILLTCALLFLAYLRPWFALPDSLVVATSILIAEINLSWILSNARAEHDEIIFLFIVPLLFGALALRFGSMLVLSCLVALLVYGGRMRWNWSKSMTFEEFMSWLATVSVMFSVAMISSYTRRLQEKLRESRQEMRAAFENFKAASSLDDLTGVIKRGSLDALLHHLHRQSLMAKEPYCAAMIDIDHFKQINDTFGHLVGDEVLKRLTQAAGSLLRPQDVLGRYGGDEFMLLLPKCDIDQAARWTERLRVHLNNVELRDISPELKVSVTIGVTEVKLGEPEEEIVRRADMALYQAKQVGRNMMIALRPN